MRKFHRLVFVFHRLVFIFRRLVFAFRRLVFAFRRLVFVFRRLFVQMSVFRRFHGKTLHHARVVFRRLVSFNCFSAV